MIGTSFKFEVISCSLCRKMDVQWVDVSSPSGNFVIIPGHSPFVSLLTSGSKLTFKDENNPSETISVPGGIMMVNGDGSVRIVLWDEVS